jgi:glycosyltransferase involved in cell wall biosynthesis
VARAKILHFIDTLGAGGAERQLVYLLENLNRDRFDCHVLTTYDTFRHYEAQLHQLDIPLYSLHHGDLRIANRAGAIARYTQVLWTLRPQIVHSWLHYPNLIARVTRPLCPPHCLITAIRTEYSPRQQFSEQMTVWLSDFRIVNYKQTNKNPSKLNITYIPNVVKIPLASARPNEQKQFIFLMVARIDPRKDHLTLLNALHILQDRIPPDIKFLLIGEVTDTATQAQITTTINTYHLHEFVQQLPTVHDISTYYRNSSVVVLPSQTEGSSNVILEAFAAAKPILISNAANREELVIHGINGWVFPAGDSHALATLIKTAWQIPQQERDQMGVNGRVIAEQYSISRMMEQYTQLYERALSRS